MLLLRQQLPRCFLGEEIQNEMKNKKYHAVQISPKSKRKAIERGKIDITNTQIHDL